GYSRRGRPGRRRHAERRRTMLRGPLPEPQKPHPPRRGVAWESPPPTKITASKAASTRIALRANVPSLISFKVIVLLFRSYVGFHLGVLGRRISPAGAVLNRARRSNAGVPFPGPPPMPH